MSFGLALRRGKMKRRGGAEPAEAESAAERAAQGQTEADAVAFPSEGRDERAGNDESRREWFERPCEVSSRPLVPAGVRF